MEVINMKPEEMKSVKIDDVAYRRAKMISAKTDKKIYVVIAEALDAADKLIIEIERNIRLKKAYNNLVEKRRQEKQR